VQAPVFDAVFAQVFGGVRRDAPSAPDDVHAVPEPGDERRATPGRSIPGGDERSPAGISTGSGREGEVEDGAVDVPVAAASAAERLGERSFDTLAPDELARLYELMSRLRLATPLRRTRRYERGRHGQHVDMRRTLRSSLRTGGDPIRLARRRRRIAPRRLVMLCDISGSMEPYARAYLQFLTCAAGSGPNAEAFVFATRLTRLTRALGSRHPERAMKRAAAAAPDWSSGTRIGDALKAFNDHYGSRGMARGAVVLIISDGWETGDPALLGAQMARLHRVAHRIVWANPRTQSPRYRPEVGGMAAAWPYCDAVVSAHNLDSLDDLLSALRAR